MHGDCPSGIRHGGGAKLNLALVRNVRTWPAMPREKAQAAPTARPKVLMRRRGADCPVVVLKRGNARGAKGVGHRRWERANWQQEELQFSTEGGGPERDDARGQGPDLEGAGGEIPRAYSVKPGFTTLQQQRPLHPISGHAAASSRPRSGARCRRLGQAELAPT